MIVSHVGGPNYETEHDRTVRNLRNRIKCYESEIIQLITTLVDLGHTIAPTRNTDENRFVIQKNILKVLDELGC